MNEDLKIASFYKFCAMRELEKTKENILQKMESGNIRGTIIIANEGFNGTVAGNESCLRVFIAELNSILGPMPTVKYSKHSDEVFRRRKVKIKKEIVTLKREVDFSLGNGTHVDSEQWNRLIADNEVILIDARNDYEFKVGAFKGAINPNTKKFSELPDFIETEYSPADNPKIAMYCTGGIRCEKLAPYLISRGFENIFQLDGGILTYLEKTEPQDSLWEGECFVFDERITVDEKLRKGKRPDLSVPKDDDNQ